MRLPKPRKTLVHGKVRWLVRAPKALGGRRYYYEFRQEADNKLDEITKATSGPASQFSRLTKRQQAGLLYALECFDGDVEQLLATLPRPFQDRHRKVRF